MARLFVIGVIAACCLFGTAFAQDEAAATANAYGYTYDDVAVNQGIVLYWYAHGYANCWGCLPQSFAEMVGKGLPLRKFMSPHTGEEINPDDGSLDFDGDMIMVPAQCGDIEVQVQTSKGVVKLPGYVSAESNISAQFDPCCYQCLYPGCAYIAICDYECWDVCDDAGCACKVVEWMMWKSFEIHEVLFGSRPAGELAWYASGIAPIDKNYKEYVPTMDIEFIIKGKCGCCILKKAYVTCCAPCKPCSPCSPCEPVCKPKCDPCNPCAKKCNTCVKPCETKCNPCKPKCEPQCKPACKPKCDPCNPCEKKCGSCVKPCESKCNPCKPKCESKCSPCKPKCETKCVKKCNPCGSC